MGRCVLDLRVPSPFFFSFFFFFWNSTVTLRQPSRSDAMFPFFCLPRNLISLSLNLQCRALPIWIPCSTAPPPSIVTLGAGRLQNWSVRRACSDSPLHSTATFFLGMSQTSPTPPTCSEARRSSTKCFAGNSLLQLKPPTCSLEARGSCSSPASVALRAPTA